MLFITLATTSGVGAPLTIDAEAFKTAAGDVEGALRQICHKVHGYGDVAVGARKA